MRYRIKGTMEKPLDVAVYALAVSRLSRLITDDYVTEPLRAWMSSKGEAWEYLSTCPACTSMYTGVIAHLLPRPVKLALAASELTVLARQIESKLEDPSWSS